jgi:hypothetical protein
LEGRGARGTYVAAPKVELTSILDLSMNTPPSPDGVWKKATLAVQHNVRFGLRIQPVVTVGDFSSLATCYARPNGRDRPKADGEHHLNI